MQVAYSLMVDRFANGDLSNDQNNIPSFQHQDLICLAGKKNHTLGPKNVGKHTQFHNLTCSHMCVLLRCSLNV